MIQQGQPSVVGEEHVPAVGICVVEAGERDLADIGPEEVARQPLSLLRGEAVIGGDALAADPLEHETRSVTYGWITCGTTRSS